MCIIINIERKKPIVICKISVRIRPLTPKKLFIVISGKSKPNPEIISKGTCQIHSKYISYFLQGIKLPDLQLPGMDAFHL